VSPASRAQAGGFGDLLEVGGARLGERAVQVVVHGGDGLAVRQQRGYMEQQGGYLCAPGMVTRPSCMA
jgi:hypothetical protein